MTLGIYGAGGLGREILELAKQINGINNRWDKIIFIDDGKDEASIRSVDIMKFQNFVASFSISEAEVCIALGEPFIREGLVEKVKNCGFSIATLIHPTVYIPDSTRIGYGVIICMGAFISCDVVIEDYVLIQPHVNVGHDCIIRKNTVISGFVNIAGACEIMENSYIALSVCIKEKVKIGEGCIVGMGAVVLNDIPDYLIALGNPARSMRRNEEKRVFKN